MYLLQCLNLHPASGSYAINICWINKLKHEWTGGKKKTYGTILSSTSDSLYFSYALLHNQNLLSQNNITNLEFGQDTAGLSLLYLVSLQAEIAWSLEAGTIQTLTLTSLDVDTDCQLEHQLGFGAQHLHLTIPHDCLASLWYDRWVPSKIITMKRRERQVKGVCITFYHFVWEDKKCHISINSILPHSFCPILFIEKHD